MKEIPGRLWKLVTPIRLERVAIVLLLAMQIYSCRETRSNIDELDSKADESSGKAEEAEEKITELESRIDDLESELKSLKSRLDTMFKYP